MAAIYSKRDLEKLFNLRRISDELGECVRTGGHCRAVLPKKGAVRAVCDSLDRKNRRRALLVMATDSGRRGRSSPWWICYCGTDWVKNVLFLADRNSLVTQAKRSFVNLLPDLSVTNLCEEKDNCCGPVRFFHLSDHDELHRHGGGRDEGEAVHLRDISICSSATRPTALSINKYQDIFTYFDAPLVGLTATPKDEIDKNTYEVFELQSGVPTYGYDLAQAVKDGFLVDFLHGGEQAEISGGRHRLRRPAPRGTGRL